MWPTAHRVGALVLLVTWGLAGCRRPPIAAPDAAPPTAFSAEVRVEVRRGSERARARGFVAAWAPDRLRLELLDPIGRTRLLLVASGGFSRLILEDTYAEAASGDRLLRELTGAEVGVGRVVACLLGAGEAEGIAVEAGPSGLARRVVISGDGATIDVSLSSHEGLGPDPIRAFGVPDAGNRRELAPGELPGILEAIGS